MKIKWRCYSLIVLGCIVLNQMVGAKTYGEITTNQAVAYSAKRLETKVFEKNEQVEIVESPNNNHIYKIKDANQTWKIIEDAVKIKKVCVEVQQQGVRIRQQPDPNATIMKELKQGEAINIYHQSGNWYHTVLENGQDGFIYKDQLQHPNLQRLPEKEVAKAPLEAITWSQASRVFSRGRIATIEDVYTGKTFKVKRTFGTNHADIEALTTYDTQVIKSIWGGFSWERRPVIVHIDGRRWAASMAGMPHAGNTLNAIKNNGMYGVMDLHFRGSRRHKEGTIAATVDPLHQKAISIALSYR